MSINQRKRKKRLLPRDNGDLLDASNWHESDIPSGGIGACPVDGFIGLDELTEYNENQIRVLVSQSSKKSKGNQKQSLESDDDERCVETVASVDKNQTTVCKSTDVVPKLTKKQRRKLKQKESFKLKLKERRKRVKEMKRKQNSEAKSFKETASKVVKDMAEKPGPEKEAGTSDICEWFGLGAPKQVLKALADLKYTTPTPIQRECLPHAIFYRQDIVGAAETGSGKTLAFGIPLIANILEQKEKRNPLEEEKPLYALILTPTRELAVQIQTHLQAVLKYTNIACVAVVGGLAMAKQERLLGKCPEIVVGTPGRLHTLVKDGELHLNKFDSLMFLVVDECDRMVESGHFKELDELLELINKSKGKKQKFVFSATLSLPQHHRNYTRKQESSPLQQLVDKIGFNQKAKVIDLTTKHVTASMLRQQKVMCTHDEKDAYLMYFLVSHPGRTIVFVNSISLSKKLCSLFTLLGCEPLVLHAGKQQKQRLKCLERFLANDSALLIATDVAARGLDIPKVQNVVHYQLPKDPKVYIHRAGRTARANENGLSFILEGPDDFQDYKKISQTLKLNEGIPTLDIDRGFLDGVKQRVELAKSIDKEEYKVRKESSEQSWMRRAAKSIDVEVEDEEQLSKETKMVIGRKKKELKMLLATKLLPKGFSGVYPTRSGKLVVPGIQAMTN